MNIGSFRDKFEDQLKGTSEHLARIHRSGGTGLGQPFFAVEILC